MNTLLNFYSSILDDYSFELKDTKSERKIIKLMQFKDKGIVANQSIMDSFIQLPEILDLYLGS